MKTRIAYRICVMGKAFGSVLHEQYILPNEMHLISKFFKHHPNASHIEIERCELTPDHWLFS